MSNRQLPPTSKDGAILALDIGEARIGVARASRRARLAEPLTTLPNDANFADGLAKLIQEEQADLVVVGLPRNMSGADTPQTSYVRQFVAHLPIDRPIRFQDEALTSRLAEERLKTGKKRYNKADIDAMAAAIILQDYLEEVGQHDS